MPVCKNNPYEQYTTNEPTPKGLGICASGEDIGVIKVGKDGYNYIVKWDSEIESIDQDKLKKVKELDKELDDSKEKYENKKKGLLEIIRDYLRLPVTNLKQSQIIFNYL